MLKYVDTQVTFAEVPSEITLCINISNCPCNCPNCHSSYLAKDIGKPLDWGSLNALIHINHGITCVAFMGGDSSPEEVNKLAYEVKRIGLKTAWYSGREKLSKSIKLINFDYIKLGPYIEKYGPLNCKTTNQKFYEVIHTTMGTNKLYDITHKFWRNETEN